MLTLHTSSNNLGMVYSKKGDLESATDYYQRPLKIELEQLGQNHVSVTASYNNLVVANHDKGDLGVLAIISNGH